jgi:hypothetical protein
MFGEPINKAQRGLFIVAALILLCGAFIASQDHSADVNPLYPFLWAVVFSFLAMKSNPRTPA